MSRQLTHGSLFSGIGGFDLGFEAAGFRSIFQVEKEPFCLAVLKTRFPQTEKFTDVRECGRHNLRAVDVVSAGFPCQDLSVAGKRAGLDGARSGLFWEVVRILGELRPTWFVLENVPGLFSSCEGRDFAVVLNALDELGYGLAWRVLNSQFFGVAQRRRRVFIVGRFGKPCPAEVLFESESGGGNFAQSGEARQDIAVPLTSGIGTTGRPAGRRMEDDFNLAYCLREDPGGIGQGHNTTFVTQGELAATLPACRRVRTDGHADSIVGVVNALSSSGHSSPRGDGSDNIIVQQAISSKWAKGSSGPAGDEHHNLTVASLSGIGSGGPDDNDGQAGRIIGAPTNSNGVRDFTGLPQGLDSARYRALGNAVTKTVAEWIGRRILEISLSEDDMPCRE